MMVTGDSSSSSSVYIIVVVVDVIYTGLNLLSPDVFWMLLLLISQKQNMLWEMACASIVVNKIIFEDMLLILTQ